MAGYFLIFAVSEGSNQVKIVCYTGGTSARSKAMHQFSAGKESIRKPNSYYTIIHWIIIYYTVDTVSCRSVLETGA